MKRTITTFLFAIAAFTLLMLSTPLLAQSEPPPCLHLINGYPVGEVRTHEGTVGLHAYQACSDSKGSPIKVYALSCEWSKCSTAVFFMATATITRASARVGTAHALWREHVKFDCTDAIGKEDTGRGRLCRERWKAYDDNKAAWGFP